VAETTKYRSYGGTQRK